MLFGQKRTSYWIFSGLCILMSTLLYKMEAKDMNSQDPLKELRSYLITVVNETSEDGYFRAPSFADLPGKVLFHSSQWSSVIFSPDSNPKKQVDDKIEISYHPADGRERVDFDILRKRYQFRGMQITIFECTLMMYVLVSNLPKDLQEQTDPTKRAELLAAMLFAAKTPLKFKIMGNESNAMLCSTSPEKTLTMIHNWWDRVDCLAKGREIGFIIYKKHVTIFGKPDPAEWFPDEMRKNPKK